MGFADWTSDKPEHWAFEGTNMKKGDRVAQLVGWEYHGPPLGKHADLVVLSEGPVYGNSGQKQNGNVRHDDLHGAQRESRLQRRDLLVERPPVDSARASEPAPEGFPPRGRPDPADYEEHPRSDDQREDREVVSAPVR